MLKIDESTIATGSSDGLIRRRIVQPNKVLGIIGDHEDFPVEGLRPNFDNTILASFAHDDGSILGYFYVRDDDMGEDEGGDGDVSNDDVGDDESNVKGASMNPDAEEEEVGINDSDVDMSEGDGDDDDFGDSDDSDDSGDSEEGRGGTGGGGEDATNSYREIFC